MATAVKIDPAVAAAARAAARALQQQIAGLRKQTQAVIASINVWAQQQMRSATTPVQKKQIQQQAQFMRQEAQQSLQQQILAAREQAVNYVNTSGLNLNPAYTFTGDTGAVFTPAILGGGPAAAPLPGGGGIPVVTDLTYPASTNISGLPSYRVTAPITYPTPYETDYPAPTPTDSSIYYPQPGPDYQQVQDYYVPSEATMLPDEPTNGGGGGPVQVSPEIIDALTQQNRAVYEADPWSDVWGPAFQGFASPTSFGFDALIDRLFKREAVHRNYETGASYYGFNAFGDPARQDPGRFASGFPPYLGFAHGAADYSYYGFNAFADLFEMGNPRPKERGPHRFWPQGAGPGRTDPQRYPSGYHGFGVSPTGLAPYGVSPTGLAPYGNVAFGGRTGRNPGMPLYSKPIVNRAPVRMRKRLSIVQALNAMPIMQDFGQWEQLITAAGNIGSAAVSRALTPSVAAGAPPGPPVVIQQPQPQPAKSDNTMLFVVGGIGLVAVLAVMMASRK